ncbi:MoxR family ATPase [Egibacter rhizosphaerae]|uniref:MoxR family ATPase n=1 Tax=Egibacter rhizosphaerae TaxID=1670831 RepID=A0A411YL23_9ACTN|nr:MoxR family ATPase [Egibacter rhizosphaerae]
MAHAPVAEAFTDPAEAAARLEEAGYLADDAASTVAYLADALGKPILAEGPAGVGKTELARAAAIARDARLVRLQCYEGLDEASALYEWDYRKQLLAVQAQPDRDWDDASAHIYGEAFLLERPLLRALRSDEPTVLLIDEVDKVDVDFEALLLEILDDYQVSVPELGTVTARRRPYVVLTSNRTRELSEALKRRCLYLSLDYPDPEREAAIVRARVPDATAALADRLAAVVRSLRELDLRKPPSIAETIDWARTLLAIAEGEADPQRLAATAGVVLKHDDDLEAGVAHLRGQSASRVGDGTPNPRGVAGPRPR